MMELGKLDVVVPGKVGRGRPKLGWQKEVEKYMVKVGLSSVGVVVANVVVVAAPLNSEYNIVL